MKKEVLVLFFIGILLISPLILAQENNQAQKEEQIKIYSGFDRFIDNVKMFFTTGDKKVILALNIREKELNSAIVNTENGNEDAAEKNLERAKKKLQYVQEKVSGDIAGDVKINVDKVINEINKKENLPKEFQEYILEEEKTQLTAELVIEVEGKEGQTLTREIVKNEGTEKEKVEIVVEGEKKGENIIEIEEKIVKLEKEIEKVDNVVISGGDENDISNSENTIDIPSKTKDNEDVAPKPNIVDDDVAPGPQGIIGNQGYSDDEGHHGDIPDDTSGASGEVDED